ncbi:REXO1 exonuclease, partial [Turnix velox]|nr:REXO1 exonuclease [Turnix velox]
AERGYDPYNPELPRASLEEEDEEDDALTDLADVAPNILELELVNKAIEAVKNEVEREQKKYEELLETTKELSSTEASSLISNELSAAGTENDVFTSLEYNPGTYNFNNNSNYNPTPLTTAGQSSKYTLDGSRSKGSSLEYVPKTIIQNKKYTSTVTNNKYVIDDSKPSTDLEYDPLSNYSARLLSKASTKETKGSKRGRVSSYEEYYSPLRKKLCEIPDDYEARFSSSEDETDAEYKTSSVSSQSKAGSESESNDGMSCKEQSNKPSDSKEAAARYGVEELPSSQKNLAKNLTEKNVKEAQCSGKNEQETANKNKESKDKTKRKRSDVSKTLSLGEDGKKEKSKNVEKDKERGKKEEKLKTKNDEKNCKHKSDKVKTDGSSKKPEKPKSEKVDGLKKEKSKSSSSSSSSRKSKSEGVSKGSGSEKLGSSKKDSRLKGADLKNGKKDKEKGIKSPAPERKKEKASSTAKGDPKEGRKQRSLSHVDLFGDESGDENDKGRPLPSSLLNMSSDSDGGGCGSDSESENERTKKAKHSKRSKSSSSSSTSDDIDYSVLDKDLDLESDPMEECLRIFNESTDVKTEDKGRLGKQHSREEGSEEKAEENLTTLFPGQKRRISHLVKQGNKRAGSETFFSVQAEVPNKPVVRPYRPPTAQEVCYQRIHLAQQQAAQLIQKASLSLPGEKRRIAHVPNAALAAAAKQNLVNSKTQVAGKSVTPSNDTEAPTLSLKACTIAGMASKTTSTIVPKRVAHIPSLQSTSLQRPVIPTEFGAKVPTNIRQRYLNLFIDECLKFCSSSQEAFDKALSEEKVAYERSTSRNIYLNVAVNTLKKLRSLAPTSPTSANKTTNKKVVSHEAVLGGKLAAKTSFTLNRSGSSKAEDLTGPTLYRRLKEYLMTEEQLKENGYPMPHPDKPGRAVLYTAEEKKTTDSSCRICCRCGTEYMVSASGSCIRKEECVHHWGRLRKQRVPGGWETHYSCCSGAVGSPGCQVAKQHVHDGRKESLDGFVKTFDKLPTTDGYPGIYALDCEMCYTKQGLELTRVTVINSDLKVVYDTFVKPDSKVVDYNTRFSGVTEEDLENTSITLRDVQAVLLNMFSADTILIGHSLESDLFALKLIHGTVVDTAIVFPHRLGLPYKRALRTLMADYLKRIIQDNVEGHDSSEDARACMELMVWKIKEDAKVKR